MCLHAVLVLRGVLDEKIGFLLINRLSCCGQFLRDILALTLDLLVRFLNDNLLNLRKYDF